MVGAGVLHFSGLPCFLVDQVATRWAAADGKKGLALREGKNGSLD